MTKSIVITVRIDTCQLAKAFDGLRNIDVQATTISSIVKDTIKAGIHALGMTDVDPSKLAISHINGLTKQNKALNKTLDDLTTKLDERNNNNKGVKYPLSLADNVDIKPVDKPHAIQILKNMNTGAISLMQNLTSSSNKIVTLTATMFHPVADNHEEEKELILNTYNNLP